MDLNVEEAWALGYTGKNITTAIMDDGVDYTHPDLMHNYVCSHRELRINSWFFFRMQRLVMITAVMIDIPILGIRMIGLIGKRWFVSRDLNIYSIQSWDTLCG